jgi:uncharacterized membrane protein HdeD (DUF308 family)
MDQMLAHRWWIFLVRGLFAILFGVLCFVAPLHSLYALVMLFGIYAIVDGGFNVGLALRRASDERHWGALLVAGLLGIGAGLLAIVWPRITALALVLLIAAWSIATGITSIVAAIRLRQEIKGEWLLGLAGALSIAFGVLVFMYPGTGALALVLWIGAYALVAGVVLSVLAFRIRSWVHHDHAAHPPSMPAGARA